MPHVQTPKGFRVERVFAKGRAMLHVAAIEKEQ
jgi:hypothetical protein